MSDSFEGWLKPYKATIMRDEYDYPIYHRYDMKAAYAAGKSEGLTIGMKAGMESQMKRDYVIAMDRDSGADHPYATYQQGWDDCAIDIAEAIQEEMK